MNKDVLIILNILLVSNTATLILYLVELFIYELRCGYLRSNKQAFTLLWFIFSSLPLLILTTKQLYKIAAGG